MRLSAKEARKLFEQGRLRGIKGPPMHNPAEQSLKEIVRRHAKSFSLLFCEEHAPISGRRFRLDAAIVDLKLGFECDGWQYHAKHKNAWLSEKKRDRLFLLHGWKVFRFAASEILSGSADQEIYEIIQTFARQRCSQGVNT